MPLSRVSDVEFLKQIEAAPVIVDQWQLEKLALVTTRQQLFCYVPGHPAEYHSNVWGRISETLDAAMRALFDGLPASASVAVIPEGPYVLAKAPVHEMVTG